MSQASLPYRVFGGFTLPTNEAGTVSSASKKHKEFWAAVEDEQPGLSGGLGCYIFTLNNFPWYVGKTEASFRQECFQHHKLSKYRDAQDEYQPLYKPKFFFIARMTATGKLSAKKASNEIEYLEHLLIGWALQRNDGLTNKMGTSFLSRLQIPGLLNTPNGSGNATSKALRKVLGR